MNSTNLGFNAVDEELYSEEVLVQQTTEKDLELAETLLMERMAVALDEYEKAGNLLMMIRTLGTRRTYEH